MQCILKNQGSQLRGPLRSIHHLTPTCGDPSGSTAERTLNPACGRHETPVLTSAIRELQWGQTNYLPNRLTGFLAPGWGRRCRRGVRKNGACSSSLSTQPLGEQSRAIDAKIQLGQGRPAARWPSRRELATGDRRLASGHSVVRRRLYLGPRLGDSRSGERADIRPGTITPWRPDE
jgi:hypothetical protein